MRLTVTVKLQPTHEQASFLRETMERANTVCNHISEIAWQQQMFGKYALHHVTYHTLRASSGLSAQVIVRCIAKVSDAYALDKKTMRVFRPHGSIAYDDRILTWKTDSVSIWTVGGRQKAIPFVCGERERALLPFRQGESDLVFRDDMWFVYTTVNVEEPPLGEPTDWLGVDMGIVNLATDSDGTNYSGDAIARTSRIYAHRRRNLQRKQTKSAKRKLRHIKRGQSRFQSNTNHIVSKHIVAIAKGTQRGIALEDLTGIRERTEQRLRRKQRARHANWSFFQLRSFLDYKAQLAGVPLVFVDPRNTSRECPVCGCVDRRNRKTQAKFVCISCGFAANADVNAARTIRARAIVNSPNGVIQGLNSPGLGTSLPALRRGSLTGQCICESGFAYTCLATNEHEAPVTRRDCREVVA